MAETVYQVGMGDPDQWDDTLLIQQYNDAMAKVKKQVNERIMSKQTTEEGKTEMSLSEDASDKPSSTTSSKKKKKRSKNKFQLQWTVGDHCRCVYEEDSWEYEATIVDMSKCTATVQFVGYGNVQTANVSQLLKSKGSRARQRQEAEAKELSEVEESGVDEGSSSDRAVNGTAGVAGPWQPVSEKPTPGGESYRSPLPHPPPPMPSYMPPRGGYHHEDILPPPPPPPGLPVDDEPLHTMLMSWYMTGYHTGYYRGVNAATRHKRH